jgi:hypothetical protein
VFDSRRGRGPGQSRSPKNATETATIGGVHIKTPNIVSSPSRRRGARRPGAEAAHGKEHWLKAGLIKALENPEYYMVVMFGWGHRLAVLLLPMLGLSLALVYLNKRQYFIYDHLIVATNLLSFAFLTNALGLVLPDPVRGWWFVLLMIWTPINLFQTLRGGYGSSIPGAIIKTLIVWWSTMFSFVVLLTGCWSSPWRRSRNLGNRLCSLPSSSPIAAKSPVASSAPPVSWACGRSRSIPRRTPTRRS